MSTEEKRIQETRDNFTKEKIRKICNIRDTGLAFLFASILLSAVEAWSLFGDYINDRVPTENVAVIYIVAGITFAIAMICLIIAYRIYCVYLDTIDLDKL